MRTADYRLLILLLLCFPLFLTIPAAALENAVLQLPNGSLLVPGPVLEKMGVKCAGDQIITLSHDTHNITLLLDTIDDTRDDRNPPCRIDGVLYLPAGILNDLGMTITVAKTTATLSFNEKTHPQTISCPLQILPLQPKAMGCHPIIAGRWLIGGIVHGVWADIDKIQPMITGKERYRLYGLQQYLSSINGGPAEEGEQGYGVSIIGDLPDDQSVIGIACEWNALPRRPRVEKPTQKVYLDEVRRILDAHDMKTAPVKLQQVIRVDLDGDGKDEVLLAAANRRIGDDAFDVDEHHDFSFIAVRKIIDGTVQTSIPIAIFTPEHLKDGAGMQQYFSIAGVLDVDNDGRQEILVREQYFGAAMTLHIFKYHAGRYWPVLEGGFSD